MLGNKKLVVGCFFTCSCLLMGALIFNSDSNSARKLELPHIGVELPPLKHMNTSLEKYMSPLRDRLIRDRYTVLMLTYRRNDLLLISLKFHCSCTHVDKILIIWNNVHETVPAYLLDFPCQVNIIFIRQQRNSLNNRFKPYAQIRTEGERNYQILPHCSCSYVGVLVVDDDRLQKHKDIELAYKTWKV